MGSNQNSSMKFEILSCAIDLFKKHGYKQVSINQICNTVGISKTTFYYYYDSKESLITSFYAQVNFYAKENIVSILAAEDSVEQLWNICEMYIKPFNDAGVVIVRELFNQNFGNDALAIAPDHIYLRDVMIALIQRAKDAGQIKNPASAEVLFETLVYVLDGISFIWVTKNGDFDLAAKSREAFDIHLMVQKK